MRSQVLLLAALAAACGSKAKPAPEGPAPAAFDPNVLDVKELPPLAAGFHYDATLHQYGHMSSTMADPAKTGENKFSSVDLEYAVALLEMSAGGASKVRLDVASYSLSEDGQALATLTPSHSYLLTPTAVTHADGSAVSKQETTEVAELAQRGVFALPVRDGLVGLHLEKGKTVTVTAQQIGALVLQQPQGDLGKAELTLRSIDDNGLATLDLVAEAGSADKKLTWSLTGTVTVDVRTVLPHAVKFDVTAAVAEPATDIAFMTGGQTVDWTFRYPG